MDREIRDLLKESYLTFQYIGNTEKVKGYSLDDGKAAIIVARDNNNILQIGHVYSCGERVKYPNTSANFTTIIKDLCNEHIKLGKIAGVNYDENDVLTKSEFSCYNIENDKRRSRMDNNQEQIRNIIESGEKSGTTPEGVSFEVKQSSGVRKIKFGDQYYTAIGTKRIRILKSNEKEFNEVPAGKAKSAKSADKTTAGEKAKKKRSKETLPPQLDKVCDKCGKPFKASKFTPYVTTCSECKPRRGGEPKPARINVKCEKCGKEFETSKFTPNVKLCPDCKPRRAKGESKPVEPRKCEVTGEMFTPSKFNPNATVSPEGKKILKDRKAKDGRIEDAFNKCREIESLKDASDEDIKSTLEKAWENEEIRATPSLVKAVKDHLGAKPKKEAPKAYEASDAEQDENLK